MKTLRPHQVDTVRILARGGLNASGLGAGKTLASVEACRLLDLDRLPRVLTVAPPPVLGHWERTFAEQFPTLAERGLLHVVGTHRKDPENWARMTRKQGGVYLIGWNAMHGGIPEETRREASRGVNANRAKPKATLAAARRAIAKGTVPPWTRTGTWDLLILDEVHRAVNRHGVPRQVLKLIKADVRLALSATPGGSRPEGLWTVLNLLWPDRYPDFWGWVGEHFEIVERQIYKGGRQETYREIGAELRPGSVWRDIPAVVRHRTEEIADLPDVIERTVTVRLTGEQERQYRDFEQQSLAWLGDQPVAALVPIEQRTRLRQAALGTLLAEEIAPTKTAWVTRTGLRKLRDNPDVHSLTIRGEKVDEETGEVKVNVSYVREKLDIDYDPTAPQPKLDAVRDILADLPEAEPVLIWTHSAKWARMAEKALGRQAVAWTLKTTAAKRKKIEAGFGTEWRVLIAQLQSLSEGVDWLKDVCRCEIIASSTESPVWNEQAEGRLRRPGQRSPVQRWRLLTEDTIDDDVELNNLRKRARMASLYGDDRRTES